MPEIAHTQGTAPTGHEISVEAFEYPHHGQAIARCECGWTAHYHTSHTINAAAGHLKKVIAQATEGATA